MLSLEKPPWYLPVLRHGNAHRRTLPFALRAARGCYLSRSPTGAGWTLLFLATSAVVADGQMERARGARARDSMDGQKGDTCVTFQNKKQGCERQQGRKRQRSMRRKRVPRNHTRTTMLHRRRDRRRHFRHEWGRQTKHVYRWGRKLPLNSCSIEPWFVIHCCKHRKESRKTSRTSDV